MSKEIKFRFIGEIEMGGLAWSEVAKFLKKAGIDVVAKDDGGRGRVVTVSILDTKAAKVKK